MDTVLLPLGVVLPVVGWLVLRLQKAEKERSEAESECSEWQERWAMEVRRNVELYAKPSDGRPARPPAPDWEESTKVRRLRERETSKAVDAELERYLDSTPPGVPHPQR